MNNYDLALNLSAAVVAAVVAVVIAAVVIRFPVKLFFNSKAWKVVFGGAICASFAWLMVGIILEARQNGGDPTVSWVILILAAVAAWFMAFGLDQMIRVVQERRAGK